MLINCAAQNKTDMTTPLEDVLAGRDKRAAVQIEMLCSANDCCPQRTEPFICQIALNIPGYPKRIRLDEEAVEKWSADFMLELGIKPLEERRLANGAGYCWIASFKGDRITAGRAKRLAVAIEEKSPAGRLFDIDIITSSGSISRNLLGLPQRKCLLCGNKAKICARSSTHPIEELRKEYVRLLCNC